MDRDTIVNYIFGLLCGVVLFLGGLGAILFWHSTPALFIGAACLLIGALLIWYFGR